MCALHSQKNNDSFLRDATSTIGYCYCNIEAIAICQWFNFGNRMNHFQYWELQCIYVLTTYQVKQSIHNQWRIQDFPQGGAPTPKIAIIFQNFAKTAWKWKNLDPRGGARVPGAPPWIRQWQCQYSRQNILGFSVPEESIKILANPKHPLKPNWHVCHWQFCLSCFLNGLCYL